MLINKSGRKKWILHRETNTKVYRRNQYEVKSIITDNGREFKVLGITAKRTVVKYYKFNSY